jgi:uncharacterized protein (TIGR03435 family)
MTLWALLVTHIWQSTLFAAAAGLATLMFRSNRAAVRHALWLAASVKFLVPFALLTALGQAVSPATPPRIEREVIVLETSSTAGALPRLSRLSAESRAPAPVRWLPIVAVVWLGGTTLVVAASWQRWRRVAAIARAGRPVNAGTPLDVFRRLAQASGISRPIALVACATSLEPGVFGVRRPTLLWPDALDGQFDADAIAAILAHEVAHVKRADNFTAAVHTLVHALFWFHPVVWLIGARLMDERERACDEAALATVAEPRRYAETIVKACRVFVEPPLACVSGVTGSNLVRRVEHIMSHHTRRPLSARKRIALTAFAVASVAAPVAAGAWNGTPRRLSAEAFIRQAASGPSRQPAQFEGASVKPNRSGIAKVGIQTLPNGRFVAENVTLRGLITFAYRLQPAQLEGGPSWLDSDRFDIAATGDAESTSQFEAAKRDLPSRAQQMLQSLLAERFKLETRVETRDLPIYALVRARADGRLGSEIRSSTADCSFASATCGIRMGVGAGTIALSGASMSQFANSLTIWVGRIVVDRTELAGGYDFTLRWTPDQMPQGFDKKLAAGGIAAADPNGPSIFTALQEQLGLKLDARKGPVDVLVITRAEHPTEN